MPGNFKQYDLRIIKTNKALLEALPRLLSRRNFGRITVNDICEESQLSRTAFYSHYRDKYDLLRCWLLQLMPEIHPIRYNYSEFEKTINNVIDTNQSVITNLLEDANRETMELLNEFVSSLLTEFIGCDSLERAKPFNVVLYSFCAGGIINLVLWQIKNRFPSDLKIVNTHFYKIVNTLRQLENKDLNGGEKDAK